MGNRIKDLTGQRFGSLVAMHLTAKPSHLKTKSKFWTCSCDCGAFLKIPSYKLIAGVTKSCGCIKNGGTHRMSGTVIYRRWKAMRERCYSTKNKRYDVYGGRGIKVCDEWRGDFVPFRDWAFDNGFSEELQLDRIDTNGDYSPDNCRWVTVGQNNQNRRSKRGSSSEYKGVCLDKASGKWYSSIQAEYIGYFKTEEEAAIAYNEKAREKYGEFAFLNKIKKEVV